MSIGWRAAAALSVIGAVRVSQTFPKEIPHGIVVRPVAELFCRYLR